MTAYMIFIRETPPHEPGEMEVYRRKTRAMAPDPRLTPLAVHGAVEAVEGPEPDGVILLRFPTMDDARAWYASPAYQDAAGHRKRAATYRAILVEGF